MNIKRRASNILADISKEILMDSACFAYWGEPELPKCLREEYSVADEQLQDGKV